MPATYEPIATYTISSAQASYTFSTLGSYTDIDIIINGYQSVDENIYFQFNSDTGSNYSSTALFGNGSTASSFRNVNQTTLQLGGLFTSSNGVGRYTVFNYGNSTTYKTVLARSGNAALGSQARVGLWRSTAAITSIKIGSVSGNLQVGTTLTLYGILAA